MRTLGIVALIGCGRVGFSPVDTASATSDAALDSGAPPADALPGGIGVWFPLEETGTPSTFADVISGVAGSCTAGTCPIPAAGRHGGGMRFDGVDDCIVIPDLGQLSFPLVTISIWSFHEQDMNSSPFAKRVNITTPLDTWQIMTQPPGVLTLQTYHGTNDVMSTPTATASIGVWQHFAATWDGTTNRLYLDGAEVIAFPSAAPLTYDTSSAYIGCDENNNPLLHYTGVLDDAQVYNRALSPAEIQALATM